jgi:predicted dehydrogenase
MVLRVGVVGCGQWGQNYLRVLNELDETELVAVCDSRVEILEKAASRYPSARVTGHLDELLGWNDVEAVVVAVEARSHFPVVSAALRAGKHVLCEKPLTTDLEQALALARLADACDRRLMVGHIFRYNAGVNALKATIEAADFGDICYMCLVRTNLGPIRADVNAAWDLAPHDISIVLHLLEEMPISVVAQGFSYLQLGREDVAFITLQMPAGVAVHLRVSWLDPRKVREVTVVGRGKMAVLDDVQTVEGLRVYDKGVMQVTQEPEYSSFGEFQHVVRAGEIRIPPVKGDEPLRTQVRHFADAVEQGRQPLSDAWDGVRVVAVMDAVERSLRAGGVSTTPALVEATV